MIRTFCYQSLIFLLCFIKLYFMSLLQGVITIQRVEYDSTDLILKASYMIGVLVIGNIIDNVSTPKYLSIAIQFSLAITWFSTGALVYYIE